VNGALLSCLLAHPLIVGASMSAGLEAEDPGTLLTRSVAPQAIVVNRARRHAPSADSLALVREGEIEASSLVIGLDLFYWDSFGDCSQAVARVRAFARLLDEKGARAAIGNIPVQGGACAGAVSKALAATCVKSRCVVVDLRALSEKAERNGGLEIGAKFIPKSELYADGLHPTKLGSQVIAAGLGEALSASKMTCQ
jgi:hypothetical protein